MLGTLDVNGRWGEGAVVRMLSVARGKLPLHSQAEATLGNHCVKWTVKRAAKSCRIRGNWLFISRVFSFFLSLAGGFC